LWTTKASARKKLPIKRKIIGWAKAENTALTVPSPATTQKAAPKKEVTAKGRASVIQDTTTQTRMLAKMCALIGRFGKGIR
jgi:cytoskeletal protein RodZ